MSTGCYHCGRAKAFQIRREETCVQMVASTFET